MRLFNGFELLPPALPLLTHHGIGLHATRHLSAAIEPWEYMDQGDLIEVFWNNCFVVAHTVQPGEPGRTLHLPIPESFALNGEAHLYYRVLRVGHRAQRSPALSFSVKLQCPGNPLHGSEENQFLAPLQLPETVCLNTLTRGVPFCIEPWPNMAPLDSVTLRWGDLRLDLPPLHATQVGQPISGRVAKKIVREAGQDEHLEATYCVLDRVGNASGWAPARQVRVYRDSASIDIPKS